MQFVKTAVTLCAAVWLVAPISAVAADDAVKAKVEVLTVTSKTVKEGKSVPINHTGDGKDVSPELSWTKAPVTAKSIAVTCEDPDAPGGVWFHWIVFNLPPTTAGLPEGIAKTPSIAAGAGQGTNDFEKVGYNGPAPPKGAEHRYQFKVFALDKKLDLKPGCDKKQFYKALSGHVVGRGKLTGLYKRP
ncbi:MAG: YbhB/YbcL family Raf kinase inhibitor-like protein [Candidatus Melainabacteria bacterium]|nr:YbhB/YbcL family Raf kinase inhibitor-like protein [Candidatus Melainabacteria bacterium]